MDFESITRTGNGKRETEIEKSRSRRPLATPPSSHRCSFHLFEDFATEEYQLFMDSKYLLEFDVSSSQRANERIAAFAVQ